MSRIVFCVARGKQQFAEMALGLARSLKLINDRNPRVLMTDIPGIEWKKYFDDVVAPPAARSALDKLFGCEVTGADQVLSVDVDMLAFKKLDDIFDYCRGKPFSVQGYWDHAGSFHAKQVADVIKQYGLEDRFPRFNGGMAYYERGETWSKLLGKMKEAEADYESLGFETFRAGRASEEVCMLDAMMKCGYVDLIDMDTQFQHSLSGLVGKLHLDVLKNECFATCKSDRLEFAQPYLFHAWRYKDYTVYWNELRKLRRIEELAESRPNEYTPRLWRIQRSIERRWMEAVRKWR
jgi:hypothetical protein